MEAGGGNQELTPLAMSTKQRVQARSAGGFLISEPIPSDTPSPAPPTGYPGLKCWCYGGHFSFKPSVNLGADFGKSNFLQLGIYFFLIFKNCILFLGVCAHALMWVQMPKEARRGSWVPWSLNCTQLWAAPHGCYEPIFNPLGEQQALRIAGPFSRCWAFFIKEQGEGRGKGRELE